jgi:hypothetical protein
MDWVRALGVAAMLAVLAGTCGAAATDAPQAVSASYELFRNGIRFAVMKDTFEAKDGRYRIVSETRAVGPLALIAPQPLRATSSGQRTGTGLMPQLFEGGRGSNDPRRVRAEFDWEAEKLTVARRDRNESLPLPPGTQDQLSIMYQFMFLQPDHPQVLRLTRTNGRKLEQHSYAVTTGVEIVTPLGRMTTVHLVRQHQPNEDGVEVWLAPQHHYLPMKLVILDDKGARYETVMTRLEIKP